MPNEQTIDEIMAAVITSQVATAAYDGSSGPGTDELERAMFSADGEVRDLITAALAAKDAEIERLKADAERYRWLKSRPVAVPADGPDLALWADCCGDELRGNEADKAIDAAMKAGS